MHAAFLLLGDWCTTKLLFGRIRDNHDCFLCQFLVARTEISEGFLNAESGTNGPSTREGEALLVERVIMDTIRGVPRLKFRWGVMLA